MTLNRSTALRILLVSAAALSLAACGSRPKPPVVVTTPTVTAPTAPPAAPPQVAVKPVQPPAGPVAGSQQDFVINVGDLVYFTVDQFEVNDSAAATLKAQAAWLVRYPAIQVRIEGNADERGTREYNLSLGSRRASAVRDYLVDHGVAPSRISTVSFGKEKPIDAGTDDAAYQRNRNAHTVILTGVR